MPLYPFICKCGNSFDKVFSMEKAPLKVRCPVCKKTAYRNWNAYGNVNSQMKEYSFEGSNGTRLYPLAVLPSQLAEARKKNPDIEYREYNGCHMPVVHNRIEKLKFLKRNGFEEKD